MKKSDNVLVLVATNFEDIELIGTIDVLARAKIKYQLVSVENLWEVSGKYNAFVKTTPLNEIDWTKFNCLFLPGGPGYKILLENSQVITIVQNFAENNHLIAAICAAPEVLVQANVLSNQIFTSYPENAQLKNNSGKALEIYQNFITARDYEATFLFAQAIVDYLNRY